MSRIVRTIRSTPSRAIQAHLTPHLLAIDAETVLTGPTRRPAAVVIWSANGRPLRLFDAARGRSWEGRAAIVAPHFVRSIDAVDCDVLSLNFEPGHPYFPWLSGVTRRDGIVSVDDRLLRVLSADFSELISSTNGYELDRLATSVVELVCPGGGPGLRQDPRARDIVNRLEVELSNPPSVAELARCAGVSVDRLSHLFVEHIGIPMRSYIVWRRYRRAAIALQTQPDLTAVAHSVGFYDHAQMTRTFMAYFGYQPSVLRQDGFFSLRG